MGNPTGNEVVKQVGANLESWYKRNGRRLKLMGDLSLDCEFCKTKEAIDLIKMEIDTKLRNFGGEVDKLNKQNGVLFKDVGKSEKQDLARKPRRHWTGSSPSTTRTARRCSSMAI